MCSAAMPMPESVTENTPLPSASTRHAMRDPAAARRVADRVAHQVAERARDLVAAADDRRRVADVERDLVLALGQRLRVGGQLEQQRHDREALLGERIVLALERGQREEIDDQPLHVPRLLLHELQEAASLPLVELHVLHRLDEAADHRERRLELVRDVGDEVAAHARERLELRDVARHQQLLVERERHELQRERGPRVAARGDDDRLAVVAGVEVAQELGLAHEIDDRLADVVRRDRGRAAPARADSPIRSDCPRRARRCRRESPRPPAGSARSCA